MNNEVKKSRTSAGFRCVVGLALLSFCPLAIQATNAPFGDEPCESPECDEYDSTSLINPHAKITVDADDTIFSPEIFGLVQQSEGAWYDEECDLPTDEPCGTDNNLDNCYNCASLADFGTDYAIDGDLMLIGSPEARYTEPGIGGAYNWTSAVSIVSLENNRYQTIKGFQPGVIMLDDLTFSGSYDSVTYGSCGEPAMAVDQNGRQAGEFESVFAGFHEKMDAHYADQQYLRVKRLGRAVAIDRIDESNATAAFSFEITKIVGMNGLQTVGSAVAMVPIRICNDGQPIFDIEQMQILDMPTDSESGEDPTFSFGLSIVLKNGNLLISAPEAGTQQIRPYRDPDFVAANDPRRGRVFQFELNGDQWEHVRTLRPFSLPDRNVVSGPDESCNSCNLPNTDCIADFYTCLFNGTCGQNDDFTANDYFGCDMDISEDGKVVVIGAPLTIQQFIAEGFACDGCEDNGSRGWRAGGGAVYVVDLTKPDVDPYLMFNPDSVVNGEVESIFNCGCPPTATEMGYCYQNLVTWKQVSRFYAHGDYFGNSVSVTRLSSGEYRVAGSIPGDHGWVEDACLCNSNPSNCDIECPGNQQDQDFTKNLDFGYDTNPCSGKTGGLVLFEFDAEELHDQVHDQEDLTHIDPYTHSPLLTDSVVNRWFWSPGRQLYAELAVDDIGDNTLMHAHIGGKDWGATNGVNSDRVAFVGGSVDLFEEWVLVGGPYGIYPSVDYPSICPGGTETLFRNPATICTRRGATVLASFDSREKGPYEFHPADEIRELIAVPKFEDENYAPVIGFGECVKIEDGVVYSSLANYESFCESEDNCIDTNRHSSGDIHVYRGLIANCEGDFNGDGQVNGADFGSILAAWGPCTGCPEDLNGDGQISGADIGSFLALWGECP